MHRLQTVINVKYVSSIVHQSMCHKPYVQVTYKFNPRMLYTYFCVKRHVTNLHVLISLCSQVFKLFISVGWDRSSFVCCLAHWGSTDDLLLLQISSGVVWQTRDLHLSCNTLYLLSPRLCFFIVLKSTGNTQEAVAPSLT